MELFILGHEFGHICLEHLEQVESPTCLPEVRYYVSTSHQQEYDADEWSQMQMLSIKKKSDTFFKRGGGVVSGPGTAMSALLALEKTAELFPKYLGTISTSKSTPTMRMSSETHPSTKSRRDRLLNHMADELSKRDGDYLQAVEHSHLLDDVIDRFENVIG